VVQRRVNIFQWCRDHTMELPQLPMILQGVRFAWWRLALLMNECLVWIVIWWIAEEQIYKISSVNDILFISSALGKERLSFTKRFHSSIHSVFLTPSIVFEMNHWMNYHQRWNTLPWASEGGGGGPCPPGLLHYLQKQVVFSIPRGKNKISPLLAPSFRHPCTLREFLVVFKHIVTGAGYGRKQCESSACWEEPRLRVGAGKICQIPAFSKRV